MKKLKEEQTIKMKSGFKKHVLEWLGIFTVLAVLYFTGLHTEVIGTMQRALLWTGLFDAKGSEVTTTEGPMLSDAAFNLSLTTADGESVRLSDYKGKVLFINIWASWCPPCIAEMPTIEKLHRNVSDNEDIEILMISLDEDAKNAVRFMERKDYEMPYYFPASRLPSSFQSAYIPSTYVISKDGQIIYKKEGIADYSSRSFRNWLVDQADN